MATVVAMVAGDDAPTLASSARHVARSTSPVDPRFAVPASGLAAQGFAEASCMSKEPIDDAIAGGAGRITEGGYGTFSSTTRCVGGLSARCGWSGSRRSTRRVVLQQADFSRSPRAPSTRVASGRLRVQRAYLVGLFHARSCGRSSNGGRRRRALLLFLGHVGRGVRDSRGRVGHHGHMPRRRGPGYRESGRRRDRRHRGRLRRRRLVSQFHVFLCVSCCCAKCRRQHQHGGHVHILRVGLLALH
mmetsp:Transcript_30458/g.101251  ORF Transcript_30458/g.101251 Transcript_30458/m.101251 type:complete len:245 (-) Transcript_30458:175-909(-)